MFRITVQGSLLLYLLYVHLDVIFIFIYSGQSSGGFICYPSTVVGKEINTVNKDDCKQIV